MPRLAANLSLMFTESPFLDRFEAAASAGFKGVEFLFPYAWEPDELTTRLAVNQLELVLFNLSPGDWEAGERGLTALAGREVEFDGALKEALRYAQALGCRQLHAMAGLNDHGADRKTYISNLRKAAKTAAPLGIKIMIEPINTFDIPGYFLHKAEDARAILEEIDAPNLGLQLDLYHHHRMQGDASEAINAYAGITQHYQIAGPPDRGEPFPSELDAKDLFEKIDATGFEGWIGCEYIPRTDTVAGLTWIEHCAISQRVP